MSLFIVMVKKRPLVFIAILFMLGIVLGNYVPLGLSLAGLLVIVLLHVSIRKFQTVQLLIYCLLLIVGGAIRSGLQNHAHPGDLTGLHLENSISRDVGATVVGVGESRRGTPKYILEPFKVDDRAIHSGKIILYAKDLSVIPEIGDTLAGLLEFSQPRQQRNPGEFNYGAFLAGKGVYYEAFPSKQTDPIVLPSHRWHLQKDLEKFRSQVKRQFLSYTNSRTSGILSALVLGDRTEVDDESRQDFANTGVIHVLAVSGLHVGYVTLILIIITGFARLGPIPKTVAVVLGLLMYVLLTGSAASVWRASLMGSLVIISNTIERKSDIYNTLAAAALIMLIMDPGQMTNIGFQLSFSAVLSIVTLYPPFKQRFDLIIRTLPAWSIGWVNPVTDLFLISLAAQLGTLPLTLFYFQKIPLISLFANIVVVPLIGLIVATGLSFLLLGWLAPFMAQSWGALLDTLIELLLGFVHYCGSISWAYLDIRSIAIYELIFLTVGIYGTIILYKQVTFKLAIVLGLVWLNITHWQDLLSPSRLELIQLDVGQGDALLIMTPQGKTVLIDAGLRFGGRDMGNDVIQPFLLFKGISSVDLMILTHPHNDHIGGAQSLIEQGLVKQVWMPEIEYTSYGYDQLLAVLTANDIPIGYPTAGAIDSSLAPLYLRVLAPKTMQSESPSNINDASLVVQAFYGNAVVLLTGDAEHGVEKYEVHYGDMLSSDIMKAPHHGSRTSSGQHFVDLVSPEICIISLGEGNKFRHPAPSTIQRYENLDATIRRTDKEGAIIYSSDGEGWENKPWRFD